MFLLTLCAYPVACDVSDPSRDLEQREKASLARSTARTNSPQSEPMSRARRPAPARAMPRRTSHVKLLAWPHRCSPPSSPRQPSPPPPSPSPPPLSPRMPPRSSLLHRVPATWKGCARARRACTRAFLRACAALRYCALACPFKRFKPMAFLLSACGFIAVNKQV